MQAVASPEPVRVTVWATEVVQGAPRVAAPGPDRVTAGAAASALRAVNPLFGEESDSVAGTPHVHSHQDAQDAGVESGGKGEMDTVYVQCKHGWALISGEHDYTVQPVCSGEECRQEGANWLKSEGLVAAMSDMQRVVNPLCTVAVPEPARVTVRATDQGQKVEGSETVAHTEGLPGTREGPARQAQQLGGLVPLPACSTVQEKAVRQWYLQRACPVPLKGLPVKLTRLVGPVPLPACSTVQEKAVRQWYLQRACLVPLKGLPVKLTRLVGLVTLPACRTVQGANRVSTGVPTEWHWSSPSGTGTVAVPEPARAIVRDRDQRQQA